MTHEEFTKEMLRLIELNKYADLLDYLDELFPNENPDNQYSTIKENIQRQLNQSQLPNYALVQGLKLFLKNQDLKNRFEAKKRKIILYENIKLTVVWMLAFVILGCAIFSIIYFLASTMNLWKHIFIMLGIVIFFGVVLILLSELINQIKIILIIFLVFISLVLSINRKHTVGIKVVDIDGTALDDVKVTLGETNKYLGENKDNKHSFELTELNDSLHFTISIIGVNTSYNISTNRNTDDIIFNIGETKEEVDKLKNAVSKSRVTIVTGTDNNLDTVKFAIIVINQSYFWALEETKNIENRKGTIRDICTILKSEYSYINIIKARKGLICIGNACNKPYQNPRYDSIAYRRAHYLATCFKDNKKISKIYKLNFGQHRDGTSTHSDAQRCVVIVGILENQAGANEQEALYNAFLKLQTMPFDIRNFQNVDNVNKRFTDYKLFKE